MGRRFRGFRSGGVRGGGGFRSVSGSGGKSSARGGGPRLASSEFGSSHGDEEEEYPYDYCQRQLMYYYDAVRVCGSDCINAEGTRLFIKDICGIKVSPDVLEKKATDVAAAAAAAHL